MKHQQRYKARGGTKPVTAESVAAIASEWRDGRGRPDIRPPWAEDMARLVEEAPDRMAAAARRYPHLFPRAGA